MFARHLLNSPTFFYFSGFHADENLGKVDYFLYNLPFNGWVLQRKFTSMTITNNSTEGHAVFRSIVHQIKTTSVLLIPRQYSP